VDKATGAAVKRLCMGRLHTALLSSNILGCRMMTVTNTLISSTVKRTYQMAYSYFLFFVAYE